MLTIPFLTVAASGWRVSGDAHLLVHNSLTWILGETFLKSESDKTAVLSTSYSPNKPLMDAAMLLQDRSTANSGGGGTSLSFRKLEKTTGPLQL